MLNGLLNNQESCSKSIENIFFDYLPVKKNIIKSNSKFAQKYICNRLSSLLEEYQNNENKKNLIIKKHGLLEFAEDPILKLSYNEYKIEQIGNSPLNLKKVKNAQVFLENKRYDLYLLDLSVINR
jgi:hypothetical protein